MRLTRWSAVGLTLAALLLQWRLPAAADVTSTLYPYAELAPLYDDNVGLGGHGHNHGDFLMTELLGASLQTQAPEKTFGFNYSTLESQYLSTPSLDRTFRDHYLGGSYDQLLSPDTSFRVGDSLLIGNAVSSAIITGTEVPVSPQLMQGLLFRTSSLSNVFDTDLTYARPQSWTLGADAHQLLFSGGHGAAGESLGQGATLLADHRVDDSAFALGAGYNFEDFRFTEVFPATESHWPQVRLSWYPDSRFYVLLRSGPIFFDNFAGGSDGQRRSGGWVVDPGGMLLVKYDDGRRFNLYLEGGQQPGLGGGLAGAAIYRSSSLIAHYLATRSLTLFAAQGFLDIASPNGEAELVSYTVGATYRLSRNFLLTGQYYGIRNMFGGASAQAVGVASGTNSAANLFLVGIIWQLEPIRWRW